MSRKHVWNWVWMSWKFKVILLYRNRMWWESKMTNRMWWAQNTTDNQRLLNNHVTHIVSIRSMDPSSPTLYREELFMVNYSCVWPQSHDLFLVMLPLFNISYRNILFMISHRAGRLMISHRFIISKRLACSWLVTGSWSKGRHVHDQS